MAKMGRPRVLDEGKQRKVCALVSAGASVSQAAKYVGCSVATVKREAGRDAGFSERLKKAKAAASLAPLQAMRAAAQTHWRAAAWMLERADPKQFGKQNPRHLGARELRSLQRDLIDIFNDEIDHPLLRERVVKRMKAALNYAMRHAWDSSRSGNQLQAAMKFFAERESQDEGLPSSDAFSNPFGAILGDFGHGANHESTAFTEFDEDARAQNA